MTLLRHDFDPVQGLSQLTAIGQYTDERFIGSLAEISSRLPKCMWGGQESLVEGRERWEQREELIFHRQGLGRLQQVLEGGPELCLGYLGATAAGPLRQVDKS